MNKKEVERFFKGIAKDFKGDATIYLTGASAGALMGGVRPSLDIDFGVDLKHGKVKDWEQLVLAIEKNKALSGVGTNYAVDIDRWGLITLLDYKKNAKVFKRFGSLNVKVLNPDYWSIGKMTRYLDPDVIDMIAVFKARKVSANRLALLWGRALKASPQTASLLLFRRQVEHFFAVHGKAVWGKNFNAPKAIELFHKSAGIKIKSKK